MFVRFLAVSSIVFVIGCESNEKKLDRLSTAKLTECLLADADYRTLNEAQSRNEPTSDYRRRMDGDAPDTSLASAKARDARMKATGEDTLLQQVGDAADEM